MHLPAQVSDIAKWRPKGVTGDTLTAINTEWGCYGSDLLPRVAEDLELDAASGAQKGELNWVGVWVCVMLFAGG